MSEPAKIKIKPSQDFNLVYANGVFGSLTPLEGRMTFYADRLIPKISDASGAMETDYIERELQVEVKMSPSHFARALVPANICLYERVIAFFAFL